MLVTPGFINAHTHLCMILGRGLGIDRSLLHWLSEAQIPLMMQFEPEDYAVSMELGAIENLKAGNTTVCEVFFSPHYDQEVDLVAARALSSSGIRSTFFRTANDDEFIPGFTESRADIIARTERLAAEWGGDSRTSIGLGPLVPWASSPDAFRDAVDLAERYDTRIHLHTAETPEYNALVQERTGKRNVEMLDDVGALGERIMLNHCVHLSDGDIELIARSHTHVIHDPTSNMFLASGVSPVPKLRAAGINVGLACDGPACNNGQDMLEAMKDASLLHKVISGDPGILLAADVFAMATTFGARSLGLGDTLGSLKPGYLADVLLIDTRVAHMTPLHDPLAALVYSSRPADVRTVIVDGEIVVRDGEVTRLDERAVIAHASERAAIVRERAGL
jgi:5-methylthioadenosine/S-adenosylhomocysteine deaminase